MSKFQTLIDKCERDIREGRIQDVAARLARLSNMKVPREFRLALANLSRRSDQMSLGLKLLSRLIYPVRGKEQTAPTHRELAEYGALLTRAGALREATEILNRVDSNSVPMVSLYRAYICLSEWRFESAAKHLQELLRRDLNPYFRLVGQVNLAFALVGMRWHKEALTLLNENIEIARSNGHTRLLGNCLDLLTRTYIQSGEISLARASLDEAEMILVNSRSDQDYVKRSRAIIEGMESKSVEPLLSIRKLAAGRRGDWEGLRYIDRFSLLIKFDEELFNYLLFGSKHPAFRMLLMKENNRRPDRLNYVYGPMPAPCLDVLTGNIDGVAGLSPGGKCHHVIEILTRDFYEPVKLGELFTELFPGERFDIFSSPNRVHQLLFRTRQWIANEKLPVQILETNGYYSLSTTDKFSFLVPLDRRPVDGYHQHFEKLKRFYAPGDRILPKEAREKMNVSRATFFRFCAWAVEQGFMIKLGSHNLSSYQILSETKDDTGMTAA